MHPMAKMSIESAHIETQQYNFQPPTPTLSTTIYFTTDRQYDVNSWSYLCSSKLGWKSTTDWRAIRECKPQWRPGQAKVVFSFTKCDVSWRGPEQVTPLTGNERERLRESNRTYQLVDDSFRWTIQTVPFVLQGRYTLRLCHWKQTNRMLCNHVHSSNAARYMDPHWKKVLWIRNFRQNC